MKEQIEQIQLELENLNLELENLKRDYNNLKSFSTIPVDIDMAFRERFNEVKLDTKSATSEDQAVNEGGSATYSVLKSPDVFLRVFINGTTYYIPAFT